jgi:hypothetical protein
MGYAVHNGDEWVELGSEFTIGTETHNSAWLAKMTPEELAESEIYFIDEDDSTAPGIRGNRVIVDDNGRPRWRYKLLPVVDSFEKARRTQAIETRMAMAFLVGFYPSHPAFAGESLQVRNANDRSNWQEAMRRFTKQVEKGNGAEVEGDFRTTSNKTIIVSYTDAVAVLDEMSDWAYSITKNSWALKDADDAGEPYDLESGWPVLPTPVTA